MPLVARPLEERLYVKAVRSGDCLLYEGYLNPWGYGVLNRGGRGEGGVLAHRAAWELNIGSIPVGMEVDHICSVRNCIEVSHLQVVTPARNKELANERRAGMCRKGLHLLPNGPVEYSSNPNKRRCAECRREYMRNYREKELCLR